MKEKSETQAAWEQKCNKKNFRGKVKTSLFQFLWSCLAILEISSWNFYTTYNRWLRLRLYQNFSLIRPIVSARQPQKDSERLVWLFLRFFCCCFSVLNKPISRLFFLHLFCSQPVIYETNFRGFVQRTTSTGKGMNIQLFWKTKRKMQYSKLIVN